MNEKITGENIAFLLAGICIGIILCLFLYTLNIGYFNETNFRNDVCINELGYVSLNDTYTINEIYTAINNFDCIKKVDMNDIKNHLIER